MRKASHAILALFGLALILPAPASAQESQAQSSQTQSLADAARKAREKKAAEGQKAKVFTNDNLPAGGNVNVVGSATTQTDDKAKQQGQGEKQGEEKGEEYWRGRFSAARKQLADAEKELDILQRELNLMNTQYYSDPQKTLHEELERKAINEHRSKIDAKQTEVAKLKQGIEELERELRAAGGPPGWSRP